MVTTSQELRYFTKNFVKITGDYLCEEITLCCSMETWPRHIEHFEHQYNKKFTKDPLFGADLINRVHKRVQVLLHS